MHLALAISSTHIAIEAISDKAIVRKRRYVKRSVRFLLRSLNYSMLSSTVAFVRELRTTIPFETRIVYYIWNEIALQQDDCGSFCGQLRPLEPGAVHYLLIDLFALCSTVWSRRLDDAMCCITEQQ